MCLSNYVCTFRSS